MWGINFQNSYYDTVSRGGEKRFLPLDGGRSGGVLNCYEITGFPDFSVFSVAGFKANPSIPVTQKLKYFIDI